MPRYITVKTAGITDSPSESRISWLQECSRQKCIHADLVGENIKLFLIDQLFKLFEVSCMIAKPDVVMVNGTKRANSPIDGGITMVMSSGLGRLLVEHH
ncbi:hypothetical protein PGB90_000537 [Kerria lacca]